MEEEKLFTVKKIVDLNLPVIKFALQNRQNKTVSYVIDTFIDTLIARSFLNKTKEEMLNAIQNGWMFKFREMLLEEIMDDEEISLMDDMELKLV